MLSVIPVSDYLMSRLEKGETATDGKKDKTEELLGIYIYIYTREHGMGHVLFCVKPSFITNNR